MRGDGFLELRRLVVFFSLSGFRDEELPGADSANGASVLAHLAHCEEKEIGTRGSVSINAWGVPVARLAMQGTGDVVGNVSSPVTCPL
jgi:hypothetical protein